MKESKSIIILMKVFAKVLEKELLDFYFYFGISHYFGKTVKE